MGEGTEDKPVEVVYLGMSLLTTGEDGVVRVSQPSLLPTLSTYKAEGRRPSGKSNKELALRLAAINVLDQWKGRDRLDTATFYMTVLLDGKVARYEVLYKSSGTLALWSLAIRSIKPCGIKGASLLGSIASLAMLLEATARKMKALGQYLAVLAVRDLIPEGPRALQSTPKLLSNG